MKFKVDNLNVFMTPKADKMKEFVGIGWVEFEFPKLIKTVLFIHCGYIKNRKNGDDCYEAVGRLYESDNPKETGEDHIGKLYIYVYDHPANVRYETFYEQLNHHPDGSFDIITQTGKRFHIKPNK